MAYNFIPRFPLAAQILSTNVNNDRFSLIYNSVGSPNFPIGQYLFYSKHGSLWYRYKTLTQNWSNEFLFITSASSSNAKFDNNGYPVVGYLNVNNNLFVRYYINGIANDAMISHNGSLPTIIIDSQDVFVYWVPPYFNGNIYYTSLCENFNGEHSYLVALTGIITSLQIELMQTNQFLFTFGVLQNNKNKIYVAYTDVADFSYENDVPAEVFFAQGPQFGEDFVVAEKGLQFQENTAIQSLQTDEQQFIDDIVLDSAFTSIRVNPINFDEELVVAEVIVEDNLKLYTQVRNFYESFELKDINVNFSEKAITYAKSNLYENFTIADDGNIYFLNDIIIQSYKKNELFYIAEPVYSLNLEKSSTGIQYEQILALTDKDATFLFQNVVPQYHLTPVFENINILENDLFYAYQSTTGFDIYYKENIFIADEVMPEYNNILSVIAVPHFKENIEIAESMISFDLIATVYIKINEKINIEENNLNYIFKNLFKEDFLNQSIEIKENNNNFEFFESIRIQDKEIINIFEQFDIYSLQKVNDIEHFYETLPISEPILSKVFYNTLELQIPNNIGEYQYMVYDTIITDIPLTVVQASNTINSFYFYEDLGNAKTYAGPNKYTINIEEQDFSYTLRNI